MQLALYISCYYQLQGDTLPQGTTWYIISHCLGQRMIIHQVAVNIIRSLYQDLLPMAMAAMSLLLAVWSAIAPSVFYRVVGQWLADHEWGACEFSMCLLDLSLPETCVTHNQHKGGGGGGLGDHDLVSIPFGLLPSMWGYNLLSLGLGVWSLTHSYCPIVGGWTLQCYALWLRDT